jgi:hypothetical protein
VGVLSNAQVIGREYCVHLGRSVIEFHPVRMRVVLPAEIVYCVVELVSRRKTWYRGRQHALIKAAIPRGLMKMI